MPAKRAVIGVVAGLVGALACGIPGQVSQEDLPGTITAQALTLQAPTATAATPTARQSSIVQVSVTSDTNCRTGPSQNFDRVLVASPGQVFTVVGKNTPTGYWIIQMNTGGTCWLWGRYAVITGDPSSLPEYPAPPEPTAAATQTPKPTATATWTMAPSAPAAPSDFEYSRSCTAFLDGFTPKWRQEITFTWNDNSNDELGFKLYGGPWVLQTLPPNTESTYDVRTYNQGTGGPLFGTYQIASFNAAGGTFGGAVDVPRCP